MLGKRDTPQYLRTRVMALKTHKAIQSLPKGPASDKDIALVLKGVPLDNSGVEELVEFLEAMARTGERLAVHEEMMAQHIITKDRASFPAAWAAQKEVWIEEENIEATPQSAMERLYAEPELAEAFREQFGWLPKDMK
jgi:hypothetical protein